MLPIKVFFSTIGFSEQAACIKTFLHPRVYGNTRNLAINVNICPRYLIVIWIILGGLSCAVSMLILKIDHCLANEKA